MASAAPAAEAVPAATVDAPATVSNELSSAEVAAVAALRVRIQESKHRGTGVAVRYSDFELAQFIIIAKCDVEKAYRRFKNFHKLREKHHFDDIDHEVVLASARQWGGFLGVGGHDPHGRAIICMRAGDVDPKELNIVHCMYAFIHVFRLVNPDIASTRRGVVFVINMAGFGWKNFSMEMEKEFSGLYQEAYPVRIASMIMVDPPWWINAMLKICRMFLKKKLMDRIKSLSVACDKSDPNNLYNHIPVRELHAICRGPLTDSVEDSLRTVYARHQALASAAADGAAAASGGGGGAAAPAPANE